MALKFFLGEAQRVFFLIFVFDAIVMYFFHFEALVMKVSSIFA
jgi:hypothetical protein